MRGKAEIEKGPGNKTQIVITELPYQVNKARLIERIAELVREKKIEGVSDLRDESDRTGMRIVIEVKKDANPQVILNRLYKHTSLQETFGVIMIALVDGEPRTLNLKQVLDYYLQHQVTVIRRRSQYQLRRAQERLHIVEGLVTALDHIDEVINLIRSSRTDQEARDGLMEQFGLSELQAQAILDMRLRRLTGLERAKVLEEKEELEKKISYLEELLASEQKIRGVVRKELLEIKEKFGDKRRTVITSKKSEFKVEDIIPDEYVVVTLTRRGYIKGSGQHLQGPAQRWEGDHRPVYKRWGSGGTAFCGLYPQLSALLHQ